MARNFYTQIGITKKDRSEIAGCLSLMIVIPLWLFFEGIRLCSLILIGIYRIIVRILILIRNTK